MTIRVTIWNEYRHELEEPAVGEVYPEGIHGALRDGLGVQDEFKIETATLDEPEHGLTTEQLANTDVLVWWGHKAHPEISDEIVDRVHARVLDGMGLIVLHSGHHSKIFKRLMGTTCNLKWRESTDKERLWVVSPGHPIARELPECFELPREEMYGEYFDIPQPDELVMVSWFTGGEVFRSGCCYFRGRGRIFYFRPGHETYPTYFDKTILKVVANGIEWAAPENGPEPDFGLEGPNDPLEPLPSA